MLTAPLSLALFGAAFSIAIAAACVAIVQVRAARAARRAGEEERGERARHIDASTRLAGDIAHDLNNLLTAIAGHAELLTASLDPAGSSIQDAYEIRRAALSAARLTRPLHTLSGRRAPADVVDLNAVIRRTAGSLPHMLGPAIDVTLTLDDGILRVRIAESYLQEVVLNLCLHARDAMPGGGHVTVATSMHTIDEAGVPRTYVRMAVADTGGGLSAAAQSKLFEPLFAGDADAGRAVGLAKVNTIIGEAGGRIAVVSAAGAGTTFTIDLPATPEPAAASDRAPARARLTAPVLVVEDEPGMRELIRAVLVRAGREVIAVAGPHAALAMLNREPAISLMLVDLIMPEMDGYELAAEARKISPGVHVVFMSAFAPDPARHLSGAGFLAKPFTSESLISIVDEALSR